MWKSEQLLRKCLSALLVAVLFVAFAARQSVPHAEHGILFLFGGMESAEFPSFFAIILYAILLFPQLLIFGSIIPGDINRAAVFIFPRATSRMHWYLSKVGAVAIGVLGYNILLLAVYALGLRVIGVPVYSTETLWLTMTAVLFSAVFNYLVFVLLANVMGLRISQSYVLLIVLLVSIPGQLLINTIRGVPLLTVLYPSSQTVLSLHDIPKLVPLIEEYFRKAIPGFSIGLSAVYNLVFCTMVIIGGAFLVKRQNLTV